MGQVDGKAHIEKIVISAGRLDHPGEKVLRFYMSTATEAEDGANGDPLNVIAPLPADVRDPADPAGATTLDPGNGGKPGDGTPCPSNAFVLTLDAFGDAPSDFTYRGHPAPGGKKYVLATVTVKNASVGSLPPYFIVGCWNELKDGDGDTYSATDFLKKSANDPVPGDNLAGGDTKTIRYLYTIPSNESATTFSLSVNSGLKWTWNVGN